MPRQGIAVRPEPVRLQLWVRGKSLTLVAHDEVVSENSDTPSIWSVIKCKSSSWENSRMCPLH